MKQMQKWLCVCASVFVCARTPVCVRAHTGADAGARYSYTC